MRYGHAWKTILPAVGALLLAGCSAPASGTPAAAATPSATPTSAPAPATPPPADLPAAGKNLIVNGDAEAAPGTDGQTVAPTVPGWTRTGQFTAVAYDTEGSGNYPTPKDPGPQDRGRNFFSGGPDGDRSTAVQTIDVSDQGALIDGGRVPYSLSAWLGGYRGQDDQAQLSARFLGADGGVLATASLPAVLDVDRGGKTALVLRTATGMVPARTRRIEVDLVMTRKAGTANDGYADDLALVLGAA